jgi:predicted nucleic acid-binding protein
MLIAASCLRFGHRLATLNEKEFNRVEGLQLANARPYIVDRFID